jgi:CsoR family transcriptional regulator, copper-sensing transcriptional repressor
MTRTKKARPGAAHHAPLDHSAQLPRLRRIEGQVRGLQQMIEAGRDCLEVTHQVSAVVAALRRVQADMLRQHLTSCAEAALSGDVAPRESRRIAEEVGRLVARLG